MRTVDVLLVYFMVRLSILKDIIFERCNITNQIMTFSNMFGISIMVVCKIVQAFALLCDGGTDDGGDKDFVILERVFDEGASCSLKKVPRSADMQHRHRREHVCDHRGMFEVSIDTPDNNMKCD